MNKLKLYVWRDVFDLYGPGMGIALAHSADEARRLIAYCDEVHPDNRQWIIDEHLKAEPEVYDTPIGFAINGSE